MAGQPRHGINAQIWADLSAAGTMASTGTANLVLISSKNSWTFDQSRDFVDVTGFGDTSKSSVAGLANASGDITGNWDSLGTLINNLVGSTSERAFRIYPDISNNATAVIAGKAFFSQKLGGGVGAAVSQDIHYEAGPSGATFTPV